MKNLFTLICLLLIGCSTGAQENSSNSQKSKIVVEGDILISVEGIDISKYEIGIDDIDLDLEELTKDHLLYIATDECDEALIRELIEKGADVRVRYEGLDDVITNLAFCKENGVELTKLLIENGADINGADQDNDSFLSYAISYDNLDLVDYLIANGANQTQRDTNRNMGCLPIHGCESLEMLKKLEKAGFEINMTCDNGRNLLHFAARDNYKEIVQYLVNNQLVEIEQKDKNGETPLDYAKKANYSEIVKILTSR